MAKIGAGRVATVTGRYYAMDRDTRWDRVELAYKAIALGVGLSAKSPEEAVKRHTGKGENDEFVKPTVIGDGGKKIADGDTLFFFNFQRRQG